MAADFRLCPPDGEGGSSEFSIPPDPKLLAQGWVRRHFVDQQRAKESIDLYTSLGYEVKAQKLTPADFGPKCGECASELCRSHVLIYTRKSTPN